VLVSFLIDPHSARDEIGNDSESACESHESGEHHVDVPLRSHRKGESYDGGVRRSRVLARRNMAAWVEHGLLDDLVRPPQHRRRDRQADDLCRLEVNDKLELRGLLDGEVTETAFRDYPADPRHKAMPIHVITTLKEALAKLAAEKRRIERHTAAIQEALRAVNGTNDGQRSLGARMVTRRTRRGRRRMSPAARKRSAPE
jgi:hypothetical protein